MTNLGKEILLLVGEEANIKSVTHCATRLRFQFYDKALVNLEALKAKKEIVGVVDGDQVQIIIGLQVNEVYEQLLEGTSLSKHKEVDRDGKEKKNVGNVIKLRNRWK